MRTLLPDRGRAARSTLSAAGWIAFLLAAFAYRLGFGLCSEFFSDDETQIFLIGLRHHASGAWPYFGADVVWTRSQIPGALQGLLVGIPMDLVPIPEAPFVLLNLLSLASLAFFAWYVGRRLPELPRWLIWGWLLFTPWTLNYSTHVLNPDYVLCAAIVFFVGFLEAQPRFRHGDVPVALAFVMMGAATCWIMQIHMSWPLLGPFVLLALLPRLRHARSELPTAILGFLAGAAVTGSLLVPTFWKYGLLAGAGGTHRNLTVHVESVGTLISTAARLFSFASTEVGRFLGIDTAHRLQFLADHAWLIPFAVIVWVAGLLQPAWMALSWFRRPSAHAEWQPLKWLITGTILLVYSSYWFVMEPPQAHAFYLLAPLAYLYAFYCWSLVRSRRWRPLAAVVLVSSIVYHAGMVVGRAPERSLYRNREVAASAVRLGQGELLGHRRPFAVEGAPSRDVFATGEELSALRVSNARWSISPVGATLWTLTVQNLSATNAYRDIACETSYRDRTGRLVYVHRGVLEIVVQPGQSVAVARANQGFTPPFTSADVRVTRAHRLLPLPTLDRPGAQMP